MDLGNSRRHGPSFQEAAMGYMLAFDCGGTSTCAGLYDERKALIAEAKGGPSNPAETGVEAVATRIAEMTEELLLGREPLRCVAAGVAGAFDKSIRDRIAEKIRRLLRADRVLVSDDRWPVLISNAGSGKGIVAVAGTGSSVLARSRDGEVLLLGGRGSLIGDEGGAYHIALRALRACARAADGLEPETRLGAMMLRGTGLEDLTALGRWAQAAAKHAIARLARIVHQCAEEGDAAALTCIEAGASLLARQVLAAHQRLGLEENTVVYLSGGLFEGARIFRKAFEAVVKRDGPELDCVLAPTSGHRAVLELAGVPCSPEHVALRQKSEGERESMPVTEERLEGNRCIDELPALEIVRMMNREDARVHEAVAREEASIAGALDLVARAFSRGGRLVYVGSGTSGRLGVMDAVECVPTFGVPPDQVIGIIAGGDAALLGSIEGAEDDGRAAGRDLGALKPPISERDVVVGVSASGTTPYVLSALDEAKRKGAETVLLCCNPECRDRTRHVIVLETGSEVLTGSTRLKAGTATKMVLNMLSTGGMALSGHIHKGLMVGLKPLSAKLRRRAVAIIGTLAGVKDKEAEELLNKAGDRVDVAVLMKLKALDAPAANGLLDRSGGSFCAALAE